MKETLFLTISALIYTIGTTIFFYKKNKINKLENRIFKRLLLTSILSMVTELLIVFTMNIETIGTIIQKSFLVCLILWLANFMTYTFFVTTFNDEKSEENNVSKYKLFHYIFMIINVIICILIYMLPIKLNTLGDIIYTSGPSVNVVFVTLGLYVCFMSLLVFLNIKKIHKKGYFPIITLIVCLITLGIIQKSHPELLLANAVFGFIIYIMFHTIENPDMKLLTELHKSKEVSDSAKEKKTLFIYNMTQEIRTITGKIDDDADLILSSKDWDETYDTARDIKSNTSKFTNITNDILDISQINSSTIKVYNNKYNIKNVLKQIINVYSDLCKNKELKFITNIDHDIPEELYGDGISLKEALTTILNNSVKYTEKGYIELNVNTIIKNDICRLIITIEDSGIGIKSEEINNIKVSDNSLSKTNKLITVMNGAMLISSEYGIGTKIKIILDQKMEVSEDTEVKKYNDELDDIKILAVDDSEAGLKIIEKLLKGTNINLTKATTGKECIDKIKANKYELILLDEELSQITASELITKLKEIRNFSVPVVLLTKDNSYEYNEEYLKQGFVGYMLKPLKKDSFIQNIKEYSNKE